MIKKHCYLQHPFFLGILISSVFSSIFFIFSVWLLLLLLFSFISFLFLSNNVFPINSNNSFIPLAFKAETNLKMPLTDLAYSSASSLLTWEVSYLSILFPTMHTNTWLISILSLTSWYTDFKASNVLISVISYTKIIESLFW